MRPFLELTNLTTFFMHSPTSQDDLAQKRQLTHPIFSQLTLNALQSQEIPVTYTLPARESQIREQIFKWVIAKCRLTLELRTSTIEHSLRMFDQYVEARGAFPDTLDDAQLTILACLFMSNKYMEIYPGNVADFQYVCKYKFLSKDILDLQIIILETLDFNLNFPLVSDWLYGLTGKKIPECVLLSLPQLPPATQYRQIAETAVQSGILEFYEQGRQLSEEELLEQVQRIVRMKY